MADIKIGSAHIDENGNASGGKAGNQNGKEISEQKWYLHKKGWRVITAKDKNVAAYIAIAMRAACNNKHIGYDQSQRNTLYNTAKKYDFDISKVREDCETDCSALVRVCVQYAFTKCGIKRTVSSFRTTNEIETLLATGQFDEKKGPEWTEKGENLPTGAILCTKSQGHTVIVTQGAAQKQKLEIRRIRSGSWPVYEQPPAIPEVMLEGGESVTVYGRSKINPHYLAIKTVRIKGYIAENALEEQK